MKLESTLSDVFLQNVEAQVKLAKEILESPPKTLEELKTFASEQYQLNQRSLQFVEFAAENERRKTNHLWRIPCGCCLFL